MSDEKKRSLSRREFLEISGLTTLALGSGALEASTSGAVAVEKAFKPASAAGNGVDGYNILFILTDQERYFDPAELPPGYYLPGRARLQERGVTFTNHQINSAVCTSSRAVIYTGQHIQSSKMFDNLDFPWSNNLDPEFGTIGDMMGEAGYYAAYKGKWHLSRELSTHDQQALPSKKMSKFIETFGFNDYVGIGDVIGMTQGGYINDDLIGAQARHWLRVRGQPMQQDNKPWMLSVNLVNPHDVMFYNTDLPGQSVQDNPKTLMAIAREPDTEFYKKQWIFELPKSRHEPFDKKGRPPAHMEYQLARGALVGNFPNEDGRWNRLLNNYFNCIRETDKVVEGILDQLEVLGLADSTIIVMTADHGELGGSHGTHGKGATAYREQNHVPLLISHPGYPQTHGQRSQALTSHLDLAPTLMSWTGVDETKRENITSKLRGQNLTTLLEKGSTAGVNEVRESALYCFNMFGYLDSDLLTKTRAFLNAGGTHEQIAAQGFTPDFSKRGAIRSVFDGRYKFTRYFSPKEHNQPKTLEGIFKLNDVELFDLVEDPLEMNNLAIDPKKHGDLLLAMNGKMNLLLETELDEIDDGGFLPGKNANWAATRFDP